MCVVIAAGLYAQAAPQAPRNTAPAQAPTKAQSRTAQANRTKREVVILQG